MRLTDKIYHSINNRYLTASRLKDYIKDSYYFYRKHISGDLVETTTPSMLIGSMVDTYITESKAKFTKKYKAVDRRNLKNPPTRYTEVTRSDYETALAIINRLENTSLYKDIKKNKFIGQKRIVRDMRIGEHFCGIAGTVDLHKFYPATKHLVVIDLKTTVSVEQNKFRYIAEDLNYFLQLAMYGELLLWHYGDVEKIDYYIWAAENKEPYRTSLFKLNPAIIEMERTFIFELIREISQRKEYKSDLSWDDVKGL